VSNLKISVRLCRYTLPEGSLQFWARRWRPHCLSAPSRSTVRLAGRQLVETRHACFCCELKNTLISTLRHRIAFITKLYLLTYQIHQTQYTSVMHFFIRSPILWTVDLMFCAFFISFFPNSLFPRRLQTDIFETFPHDVALLEKEALLFQFLKSAPWQKCGAKTPKFRPISSLIATYYAPSLVMWKENRKSKALVFISDY